MFVFIDFFTQKGFIENFGSKAIADAPMIRENLMDLTALAVRKEIPLISLMYTGFSGADFEKVADAESEIAQQLVENASLDDFSSLRGPLEQFFSATAFIYGVPFDPAIKEFVQQFSGKFIKIWIVEDAVMGYNSPADLKLEGVKLITTRNLETYVDYSG